MLHIVTNFIFSSFYIKKRGKMKILSINPIISYDAQKNKLSKNKQNNITEQKNYNFQIPYYLPSFTATRVDKTMERFYEINKNRMPATVKRFLDNVSNKLDYTPLQAQQEAFSDLTKAKTVDDVKHIFPKEKEPLFANLKVLSATAATLGLLGLYREFRDVYTDGILINNEDLTVYLLKKIYIEAKTIEEINADLENDLIPDLSYEFKRRYLHSDYIKPSTLKGLGISLPNIEYWNSLRFTREGYSDSFGLKISEGQLKYWNSLSDEEKFDILSKRCEGRDNWWNSLSHQERLEYATGIDSDDDLFKNYKKYVNSMKRKYRNGEVFDEPTAVHTNKKFAIKSNLKEKDLFILWMKRNLEKYYNSLSEADKDTIHLKRSYRQALKWKSLTPEERIDLINKIKAGCEPQRFAMIDAWNHSYNIVKELSKFLKSKQILKPADLLYSSEKFSEFQSKIMQEFWDSHPDFAEQLGNNIINAQNRAQNAIADGTFEDYKQEMYRNRAYRKKMLERELAIEEAKSKEIPDNSVYEKSDIESLKKYSEKYAKLEAYLPPSFIKDMIETLYNHLPKDEAHKYILEILNNEFTSQSFYPIYQLKIDYTIPEKRNINALFMAIQNEFYTINKRPEIFGITDFKLFDLLEQTVNKQKNSKLKNNKTVNPERLERLYREYKQDLTSEEYEFCRYFFPKNLSTEQENQLYNHIHSFGKSILPAFSLESAFPDDVKRILVDKIIKLLPENVSDAFLNEDTNLYEKRIQKLRYREIIDGEFQQKIKYVDRNFLNNYLKCIMLYLDGNYVDDFFKSLAKQQVYQNGFSHLLSIKRNLLPFETKVQFLAMEKAISDVLFDICQDESIYDLSFENLYLILEALNTVKYNNNRKHRVKFTIGDGYYTEMIISGKPKTYNINKYYQQYLEDFNALKEENGGSTDGLTKEDFVCWLNPDETNTERDETLSKKLDLYNIGCAEKV